jgi:hypothetical protein
MKLYESNHAYRSLIGDRYEEEVQENNETAGGLFGVGFSIPIAYFAHYRFEGSPLHTMVCLLVENCS